MSWVWRVYLCLSVSVCSVSEGQSRSPEGHELNNTVHSIVECSGMGVVVFSDEDLEHILMLYSEKVPKTST